MILSYCRFHRIFRIELSESNLSRESGTDTAELFGNASIKRKSKTGRLFFLHELTLDVAGRARPDFILELIHLMAKAGA